MLQLFFILAKFRLKIIFLLKYINHKLFIIFLFFDLECKLLMKLYVKDYLEMLFKNFIKNFIILDNN